MEMIVDSLAELSMKLPFSLSISKLTEPQFLAQTPPEIAHKTDTNTRAWCKNLIGKLARKCVIRSALGADSAA